MRNFTYVSAKRFDILELGKTSFGNDGEPPASPEKRQDNTSQKKLARRKKEKSRTVTRSVTDPDCGLFVKGEHKRQFAYEAHTACDENGFVLETVVTPGNVHDSAAFDDVYDKVTEAFPEIKTVVADSAYNTPHICKKVFDDDRVLSTAYKRPQTMKGGHEWKAGKVEVEGFFVCPCIPDFWVETHEEPGPRCSVIRVFRQTEKTLDSFHETVQCFFW